jgi:hypothetical protein
MQSGMNGEEIDSFLEVESGSEDFGNTAISIVIIVSVLLVVCFQIKMKERSKK